MDNHFNEDEALDLLKQLTTQDFLGVGLDQVAYIKPIKAEQTSSDRFSIHAADGSQISVMDSYDGAIATVRIKDLFPVTLH